MNHFTLRTLPQPADKVPTDPLTELLRSGARDLIAQAVEAELVLMLEQHREHKLSPVLHYPAADCSCGDDLRTDMAV